MNEHHLSSKHGSLYLNKYLLLVIYPEGDCDTIDAEQPDVELLKRALYDEIECSDTLKHGDTFIWGNLRIVV